jgi:antitoxin component YwqK of YwqJK toxin-antitoxin module
MKYFFFFLIFICQNVFSQTSRVTGIVINAEDNSRLASASIFINNSSKGTISNTDGKFILEGITEKNFDLIISYTGFVTVSIRITQNNIGQFHTIKMVPRNETMKSISIMVPEKDGWKTWGRFFTESFIGQSDFCQRMYY